MARSQNTRAVSRKPCPWASGWAPGPAPSGWAGNAVVTTIHRPRRRVIKSKPGDGAGPPATGAQRCSGPTATRPVRGWVKMGVRAGRRPTAGAGSRVAIGTDGPAGLLVLGADARVRYVDPPVAALLGAKEAELAGVTLDALLPGPDVAGLRGL